VDHAECSPFLVVARTRRDGEYISVFDGETSYMLGVASATADDEEGRSAAADTGCFVHTSWEEAAKSVSAFPRQSAAWGAPRALLAVRGDGDFRIRHGKVMFDGVTPLQELLLTSSTEPVLTAWRW